MSASDDDLYETCKKNFNEMKSVTMKLNLLLALVMGLLKTTFENPYLPQAGRYTRDPKKSREKRTRNHATAQEPAYPSLGVQS